MSDRTAPHFALPRVPARLRFVLVLLGTLVASAIAYVPPAFAGDTQIVVQWLRSAQTPDLAALTEKLQSQSDDLYFVDGDEAENGTVNFYLFADDGSVKAAVARLIALHRQGLLPPGMRIGVANYKDADRTEWDYSAAFPPDLKSFTTSY